MEKIINFALQLFELTPDKQVFIIAILAIGLAGFSLYVVFTVFNKMVNKKEGK